MGYPIMGLGFRPRFDPIRLDGCPGGVETTKRPRGSKPRRPRSNRMGPHLPAGLIGWVFLTKRYVFVRTRAYLRYVGPEGGKPIALYQNHATISLLTKRCVFVRTRAYLRYGEPEGGKPSALYQNPGTISLFDKTIRIRSN